MKANRSRVAFVRAKASDTFGEGFLRPTGQSLPPFDLAARRFILLSHRRESREALARQATGTLPPAANGRPIYAMKRNTPLRFTTEDADFSFSLKVSEDGRVAR